MTKLLKQIGVFTFFVWISTVILYPILHWTSQMGGEIYNPVCAVFVVGVGGFAFVITKHLSEELK